MKKGFTLIELLVVVLIIGILAAVALPQYTSAVEKSRMSEAMINVKALLGAAERYRLENSVWPSNFDQLDIGMPGTRVGPSDSKTSTFDYVLHAEAGGHIQAKRIGRNSYIVAYFTRGSLDCIHLASGATAQEQKLCKSMTNATPVACPESAWSCYAL